MDSRFRGNDNTAECVALASGRAVRDKVPGRQVDRVELRLGGSRSEGKRPRPYTGESTERGHAPRRSVRAVLPYAPNISES